MVKYYDIFNGDADGICALHQLRLTVPREAAYVTGVKRDIRLLDRVEAGRGSELTVLDISLKANAAALARLLKQGAKVAWYDHHEAGAADNMPRHRNLAAHIDGAPDICTSLIVDRQLHGRWRVWAVVAAFGDNLIAPAIQAAQVLEFGHTELARLHELGECMNYNAYGATVDDLHYHPADLYQAIAPYADPRDFMINEPVFDVLKNAYREDLEFAAQTAPSDSSSTAAVFVLPDAPWARRINGIFGNRLAQAHASRAHAVLVTQNDGYVVSVRAPLSQPTGAAALCGQFAGGGGREGAAGINHLPRADFDRFVAALHTAYP